MAIRADPGEKHEPHVAISSSAAIRIFHRRCAPPSIRHHAVCVAAADRVRLLTEAGIEKLLFS